MIPNQQHPGHYWRTNDPADLDFNEAGIAPPQFIRCYNMNDFTNQGEFRDVPVTSLEYLGAGIFGEARPSSTASIRWTGKSHRYGIYSDVSARYDPSIIILERHGGGMVGYCFTNLSVRETWVSLTQTLSQERIWDLCKQIAESYHAARAAERSNGHQAFLEGRLKKRRRDRRVWVEVEPPLPAARDNEALHGLPKD